MKRAISGIRTHTGMIRQLADDGFHASGGLAFDN